MRRPLTLRIRHNNSLFLPRPPMTRDYMQQLIRENLKVTELTDRARVISGDSMEYLSCLREKFDIVLLDPPYEAGLLEPVISHIAKFDILAPHGIIVAEHPVGLAMPALSAPYRLHRTYRYGKIGLTVYRRDGNQNTEE